MQTAFMSSNVDVWSSRAVTLDCLFTLEGWKQTFVKQITEVEALFGRGSHCHYNVLTFVKTECCVMRLESIT